MISVVGQLFTLVKDLDEITTCRHHDLLDHVGISVTPYDFLDHVDLIWIPHGGRANVLWNMWSSCFIYPPSNPELESMATG